MTRLACMLLLVLAAAPARAQMVRTFVSSVNGSDSNLCTRALPCRNFEIAALAVAAGGEVVALDTGGYGAVTTIKSVSLIGAPGIHAAIAPTSGAAITIDGAPEDTVWIRNLYLNSRGATRGILMNQGAALHVHDVVASGFQEGIFVDAITELYVADSTFRSNSFYGIFIRSDSGVTRGTIVRSALHANGGVTGGGLAAAENSRVTVTDTVAVENFRGYQVFGPNAALDLERVSALYGLVGVFASGDSSAVVRVSNSTIANNGVGIEAQGTSDILSRVNNTVIGNNSGELFTTGAPFVAK